MLRRLIRRAVRQAYQLGVERPVTPDLVGGGRRGDGRGLPRAGPQRRVRAPTWPAGRRSASGPPCAPAWPCSKPSCGRGRRGVRGGGVPAPRHPRLPDRADPGDRRRAGGRGRRGRLRGGHGRQQAPVQAGGTGKGGRRGGDRLERTGPCSTSTVPPDSWATPTTTATARCWPCCDAASDGPGRGVPRRHPLLRRGRRPGRRHRHRSRPTPAGPGCSTRPTPYPD